MPLRILRNMSTFATSCSENLNNTKYATDAS